MGSNPFTDLCRYYDSIFSHSEANDTSMSYEALRLKTFHRINVNSSYIRLAKAGFYATGNRDETRCYSCGASYRGWRFSDNPFVLHRQISLSCSHIEATVADNAAEGPRFVHLDRREQLQSVQNPASDLEPEASRGEIHFDGAVYPLYSQLNERLRSFATWPVRHCKRPEDLASCGFYYAGYSDCVRCFVCGVGLRTWEEEDDPWFEHVRWRSSCDFIRAKKGQAFVIHTLATIGSECQNATRNNSAKTHQPSPQRNVADILESTECRLAIEMGFDQQQVARIATSILCELGRRSLTLEVLIERLVADEDTATSGTSRQIQTFDVERPNQTISTTGYHTDSDHGESGDELILTEPSDVNIYPSWTGACGVSTETKQQGSQQMEMSPDHNTEGRSSGGSVADKTPHSSHKSLPNHASNDITKEKTNTTSTEKQNASLPANSQATEEENQQLKESSLCKVCLDDPANIVFLPCGHLVTCVTCSPALERCPVCRKHIRGTVRVYLANMASVRKNP